MVSRMASYKNQISQSSLSDLCVYFENSFRDEESGQVDKFVGLRFLDGKLSIHFPVGYKEPDKVTTSKLDWTF